MILDISSMWSEEIFDFLYSSDISKSCTRRLCAKRRPPRHDCEHTVRRMKGVGSANDDPEVPPKPISFTSHPSRWLHDDIVTEDGDAHVS